MRTSVKLNTVYERGNLMPENHVNGKGGSSHLVESSLLLGIFCSQWMLPLLSCLLLTSVTGVNALIVIRKTILLHDWISVKLNCACRRLDVYTVEPPPKDNILVNHEKVTVTLHLGASTMEAQFCE
ncbi:hypothetical protein CTI12_AA528640 [Artemisia annua]|uniref:Uncharacterized protein n=1 Tax=Artemisia annua TaxID=35608 RepID=A0A2U1L4H9_ARTAN|nr:hypothetical protein CTI12_AA528640 [Artemisia annua]